MGTLRRHVVRLSAIQYVVCELDLVYLFVAQGFDLISSLLPSRQKILRKLKISLLRLFPEAENISIVVSFGPSVSQK